MHMQLDTRVRKETDDGQEQGYTVTCTEFAIRVSLIQQGKIRVDSPTAACLFPARKTIALKLWNVRRPGPSELPTSSGTIVCHVAVTALMACSQP